MKKKCKLRTPGLVLTLLTLSACRHTVTEPVEQPLPEILHFEVNPNPDNVLSAEIVAQVSNATQVFAEFGIDAFDQNTPVLPLAGPKAEIAVLGLRENKPYSMRVAAISAAGDTSRSTPFTLQTDPLPSDMPNVTLQQSHAPASGFVMLGFTDRQPDAHYYALIIDESGTVVWYLASPRAFVDFQKQTANAYTVFTSLDGSPSHFYQIDNLGNVKHEFRAGGGLDTGPHELVLRDGGFSLFAIEFVPMDLSAIGGLNNALVRSPNIEYVTGNRTFIWRPVDHFQVTDAAPDIPLDRDRVNPWHGNAIDLDHDGNFLVSFRNMDQVVKLDPKTGDVIWRFGGENTEFDLQNDPLNGFSHQHGVRRLANGNLLLFDNGNLHTPPVSRAVEYRLDEKAMVAELVWEYRHSPALFGFALGFAQRLANGNTLINYGTAQRVVEVTQAGTVAWEMEVSHDCYRALKIDSLY